MISTTPRRTRRLAVAAALVAGLASPLAAQASIAEDAAAGLQTTEWHLVSLGSVTVDGREPLLRLAADGTVGGSTGCNSMRAGYNTDGSNLEFGPIGTTRKYCRANWETERAFLAMLEDVRGYEIADGKLILVGGNGETLAEFRSGN